MQTIKPESYPDFALKLVNNRPNNQPNKVPPDADKIENGFKYGDIPASEVVNYQENLSGQWIRYFDSLPSIDPSAANTVVQRDQNGIANIQYLNTKSIINDNVKLNSALINDSNNLLSSIPIDQNTSENSIVLRDNNGNINAKNISELSIQNKKNFDDINVSSVGINDRLSLLEKKFNDYQSIHKAKLLQLPTLLMLGDRYDINYKFDMLKNRTYIINFNGSFQKQIENSSIIRVRLTQNGSDMSESDSIIDYNTTSFNYFNARTIWKPSYNLLNLSFAITSNTKNTLVVKNFQILICDVTGIIETINV